MFACDHPPSKLGKTSLSERFCYGDAPQSESKRRHKDSNLNIDSRCKPDDRRVISPKEGLYTGATISASCISCLTYVSNVHRMSTEVALTMLNYSASQLIALRPTTAGIYRLLYSCGTQRAKSGFAAWLRCIIEGQRLQSSSLIPLKNFPGTQSRLGKRQAHKALFPLKIMMNSMKVFHRI